MSIKLIKTNKPATISACYDEMTTSFTWCLLALGYIKVKLSISFPAPLCPELTGVDKEYKLRTLYEKLRPQEWLLMLLGHVVQIRDGKDEQGSDSRQSVPAIKSGAVLLETENWKEKAQVWLRMHCGCQSESSQLGYCVKQGWGQIFLD